MASQSLISTVNGYENYIEDKGKDEQVINAYVDACSVAINGEKDIEYGLQLTKRAKELIEDFCTAKTGGTIWDLEKYAFDHKTTYELINKKYEVLLLEAQNKIVDSYFQYIEKKREPKDRFYMPRRKQLIKIGLVDALQGMIDDKYDILCVSLVPGAGKSTIEKFFHSAVAGWFPKDYSLFYSHSGDITRMYYDGVYDIVTNDDDYARNLNHGARMLVEVDVCRAFQKVASVNFPIIIDDTESVDDWRIPQIDNQLIMLKHTQDKELVIENMEV